MLPCFDFLVHGGITVAIDILGGFQHVHQQPDTAGFARDLHLLRVVLDPEFVQIDAHGFFQNVCLDGLLSDQGPPSARALRLRGGVANGSTSNFNIHGFDNRLSFMASLPAQC